MAKVEKPSPAGRGTYAELDGACFTGPLAVSTDTTETEEVITKIIAGADDGRLQYPSSFSSTADVAIGQFSGTIRDGFVRFLNVPISVGATITKVQLRLYGAATNSFTVPWQVGFVDDVDAAAPTDPATFISAKAARITPLSGGTRVGLATNQPYFFPVAESDVDFMAALQSLVDDVSWDSGDNALLLILNDNGASDGNQHNFHDFENATGAEFFPALIIEYTTGGIECTEVVVSGSDPVFNTVTANAYFLTEQATFPPNIPGIYAFLFDNAIWDRRYWDSSLQASHSLPRIGTEEVEQYAFLGDNLTDYFTANASGAAFWSMTNLTNNTYTVNADELTWSIIDNTVSQTYELAWDNDVSGYTIDWTKEMSISFSAIFETIGKIYTGGSNSTIIQFGVASSDDESWIKWEFKRATTGEVTTQSIYYKDTGQAGHVQFTSGESLVPMGVEHDFKFRIGTDKTWEFYSDDVELYANDSAAFPSGILTDPGTAVPIQDWTNPYFFIKFINVDGTPAGTEEIKITNFRASQ